jgi:hypothetical protein
MHAQQTHTRSLLHPAAQPLKGTYVPWTRKRQSAHRLRSTPGLRTKEGSKSCLRSHMSSYALLPHSISTNGATLRPVPCSPAHQLRIGQSSHRSHASHALLHADAQSGQQHVVAADCRACFDMQRQQRNKDARRLIYAVGEVGSRRASHTGRVDMLQSAMRTFERARVLGCNDIAHLLKHACEALDLALVPETLQKCALH